MRNPATNYGLAIHRARGIHPHIGSDGNRKNAGSLSLVHQSDHVQRPAGQEPAVSGSLHLAN